MNDTLKMHKKKIIGGGAGIGISTIVYLFLQLNLSLPALQKVPDTMARVTTLEVRIEGIDTSTSSIMSEMAELRRESETRGKEIATLTAQQEMTNVLLTEVRQDIKELLRR